MFEHISVLSGPLLAGIAIQPGGCYLDVTVGGGGHTVALLASGAAEVVALDRDPVALAAAQERVQAWLGSEARQSQITQLSAPPRVSFCQVNFADYRPEGIRFDGIVADLGVSSPQLDQPERGFSFRQEGPLDMRMDPRLSRTAADWVNHSDATELEYLFSKYGEERFSRRIARHIVEHRPFLTTTQLAEAIVKVVPGRGRIHPATRVFQALRIAVNGELEALETLLQNAPTWLNRGGRLGVISFHSLEDRLVKWAFRRDPRWDIITRKPIQADPEEMASNPRARSAKLRIAAATHPDGDL